MLKMNFDIRPIGNQTSEILQGGVPKLGYNEFKRSLEV